MLSMSRTFEFDVAIAEPAATAILAICAFHAALYALVVTVEIFAAAATPLCVNGEPSRGAIRCRKVLLAAIFICARVVLAAPLVLHALSWAIAIVFIGDGINLHGASLAAAHIQIWVLAFIAVIRAVPECIAFLIGSMQPEGMSINRSESRQQLPSFKHPSLCKITPATDIGSMASKPIDAISSYTRVPDHLLPDIYIVLTVRAHSLASASFGHCLASILAADYPHAQLRIIAMFENGSHPGRCASLLNTLGLHAMARERAYVSTLACSTDIVCFWSRETTQRAMQRHAIHLITDYARSKHIHPGRIDNSVIVFGHGDTVFDRSAFAAAASSFVSCLGAVAVTGTHALRPHHWPLTNTSTQLNRQSRWCCGTSIITSTIRDAETLHRMLFRNSLDTAIGSVSECHSTPMFMRYYALKAIQKDYFVMDREQGHVSIRDVRLRDFDAFAFLTLLVHVTFGPARIRFDPHVQTTSTVNRTIHVSGGGSWCNPGYSAHDTYGVIPSVKRFWSRLSTRVTYLVMTPKPWSSPVLAMQLVWRLCSAYAWTSIVSATVISALHSRVLVVPTLVIVGVMCLQWMLTLMVCVRAGRLGLGMVYLLHIAFVRPVMSSAVLIVSVATCMARFEFAGVSRGRVSAMADACRTGQRGVGTRGRADTYVQIDRVDGSTQYTSSPVDADDIIQSSIWSTLAQRQKISRVSQHDIEYGSSEPSKLARPCMGASTVNVLPLKIRKTQSGDTSTLMPSWPDIDTQDLSVSRSREEVCTAPPMAMPTLPYAPITRSVPKTQSVKKIIPRISQHTTASSRTNTPRDVLRPPMPSTRPTMPPRSVSIRQSESRRHRRQHEREEQAMFIHQTRIQAKLERQPLAVTTPNRSDLPKPLTPNA